MPTPTAADIVATAIASSWLAGVKPKRRDVFAADLREHIATTDCPQVAALATLKSFLAALEAKRAG
jgi:hypothetical protein